MSWQRFPKAEDFPAKPVVKYSRLIMLMDVGYNAVVVPIDHPNTLLNGEVVTTTRVVRIAENGKDFETKNTKYVYQPKGDN